MAGTKTAVHPDVAGVAAAFAARELHAARGGREVMSALTSVIVDSSASSVDEVANEVALNTEALLRVMPAYAPPLNALHQIHTLLEQAQASAQPLEAFRAKVVEAHRSHLEWSERARAAIARSVLGLIPHKGTVFTFTLSETVLTSLTAAGAQRSFRVVTTESRPNHDGIDTAQALAGAGVDVRVGIDASIGEILPEADVVIVGAEAILSDGSAVCKVGTYPCALVARSHAVPFYVLVDSQKMLAASLVGQRPWLHPIEEADLSPAWVPAGTELSGHLFDRTPGHLISALITERGPAHPSQVAGLMRQMPWSKTLASSSKAHTPGVQA